MLATFQKVMNYTLMGLNITPCFLNNINFVSRESKEEHLKSIYQCSKKHEYSLRIHITKYHFAKIEIDWLGYKYSQ